jgi:hypothetical protein
LINGRTAFSTSITTIFRPATASEQYIILEFMMLEGRTVETKKKLIHLLYQRLSEQMNLAVTDLEICILESPAHNWSFRGTPATRSNFPAKLISDV